MAPNRVPAICTADPPAELVEKVAAAAGAAPSFAPLEKILAEHNRPKLDLLSVAFVVLDDGADEAVFASCHDLVQAGVPVVVLADDPNRVAMAALRAGVSDVIPAAAGADDFKQAFGRAEADRVTPVMAAAPAVAGINPSTTSDAVPVGPDGTPVTRKTVAVVSPKGGVGKTMIATNIALGLAKIAPEQTVLVDLDVFFGDVTTALNLSPEYTLPDMVQAVEAGDQIGLKSILTRHDSGLYVVGAHDSATSAAGVTGAMARRLVQMLQQTFHYVVIDTAPGLTEHTIAALDRCNELVLVSQMEVSGVRGLRKVTEALSDLQLIPGALHVVVNESDPGRGLSVEDVEANIGRKVDVEVPVSKKVPLSLNQGIPLMVDPGRDPAVKALTGLTERISGVPLPAAEKPKSLFSNFKIGA